MWLVLLLLLQFFIPGVHLRESQDGGSPSPWWVLLPLAAALLMALLLALRGGAGRTRARRAFPVVQGVCGVLGAVRRVNAVESSGVDVLALLAVSSVFSLGLVAALAPLLGSARRNGEAAGSSGTVGPR